MKTTAPLIQLRAPGRADFGLLSTLRNDPKLQCQLMIALRTHSPKDVRAWIRRRTRDPHGVFFVVAAHHDDQTLGFVQLTRIDSANGSGDLGIALAAAVRGKGIAAAALRALEILATSQFKLRKITLRVLRTNRRAIHFYLKSGFREVGVLRRHFLQDGKFRDVLLMEKLLGRGGSA